MSLSFAFLLSASDDEQEEIVAVSGSRKRRIAKKQEEMDCYFVDVLGEVASGLLQKSQTPAAKATKATQMATFILELNVRYGMEFTEKQVTKKLANLKARMKSKSDVNQTGNRPINLTKAEQKLFDLMGGTDNPAISERSCKFPLYNTII